MYLWLCKDLLCTNAAQLVPARMRVLVPASCNLLPSLSLKLFRLQCVIPIN